MVDKPVINIDILNHADFCGEFRADQQIPGLRRFYNAIESIRRQNPGNCLLLDAGDEINRLLWSGKDVLDGMSLIKTDCWTLGNHEFDRGREHLLECIDYIHEKIDVLCANIIDKSTGKLIRNVKPYSIRQLAGVKVGIIGVTTEYTEKMVTYPNFDGFKMTDAAEAIRNYTEELRKNGVEIIVVVAHIGATSTDGRYQGELFDLLEKIRDLKVDLLIGGHQNGDIALEFDGIMVNKGGFSGKSLIHTRLTCDINSHEVISKTAEVIYPLQDRYDVPDEKIDAFTDRVLAPYESYFTEVLAKAHDDILMDYNRESALGNLFADAIREAVKADFSYFNATSCGPLIRKGDITPYSIKQAIYFDEPAFTASFTGKTIRALLERVNDPEIYDKNFNICFSGIRVIYDHGASEGSRVISLRRTDGTEIADDDVLIGVTSEYMASGGNDTRDIASSVSWQKQDVMIHEAIREHLARIEDVYSQTDGRYIQLNSALHFDDH
ncbi:MAG: 5'-nucleotidase C-terminal domain-containing protein [Erysipelotrichaceae bacterium]|nr:5'-nucleotidase C-terminal domain-containing protein [Erysipelotrichaceae bacterium]